MTFSGSLRLARARGKAVRYEWHAAVKPACRRVGRISDRDSKNPRTNLVDRRDKTRKSQGKKTKRSSGFALRGKSRRCVFIISGVLSLPAIKNRARCYLFIRQSYNYLRQLFNGGYLVSKIPFVSERKIRFFIQNVFYKRIAKNSDDRLLLSTERGSRQRYFITVCSHYYHFLRPRARARVQPLPGGSLFIHFLSLGTSGSRELASAYLTECHTGSPWPLYLNCN